MNKIFSIIVPSILALAGACTDEAETEEAGVQPLPTETVTVDRDRVLEDTAQRLAGVLGDTGLRAELYTRLAERASGDFEVLLETLKDFRLADGRRLGDVLDVAFVLSHAQIAAPLGLDNWDDALPLVTFVPAHQSAELVYFDASGARTIRPADEKPIGPVLVIGQSERIGFGSHVLEQTLTPYTTSTAVYLRELVIWDDHEPWTKGDPEIYMKCMGDIRFDLPDVNEEGERYNFNKFIAYLTDAQGVMPCEVKESDGSDGDDLLGIAYFYSGPLQGSTTSNCYGASKNDFLMGVSKVTATKTFTLFGQPITVAAGCPYYYF
jgi:hypothetical protein